MLGHRRSRANVCPQIQRRRTPRLLAAMTTTTAAQPVGSTYHWLSQDGRHPVKGHHSPGCPSGLPRAWPTHAVRRRSVLWPQHTRLLTRRIVRLCARRADGCCPQCTTDRLSGGGELIFWLLLATFVHDHFWLASFGVLAIVCPVALASQWTSHCSAWINTGTSRHRQAARRDSSSGAITTTRGDGDSGRRYVLRGGRHSRRQYARSLSRLTPLTELGRLSTESSCASPAGTREPRNPVRPPCLNRGKALAVSASRRGIKAAAY